MQGLVESPVATSSDQHQLLGEHDLFMHVSAIDRAGHECAVQFVVEDGSDKRVGRSSDERQVDVGPFRREGGQDARQP
jgi:hypothetical protein